MPHHNSNESDHDQPVVNGIPNQELLSRIANGDGDALGALYRAVHERLWRFAVTLVGDHAIAQDIVQDVFVALWTRRDRLAIRHNVLVYLFVAVRHRAVAHKRHNQVVQRVEDVAVFQTDHLSVVAKQERPPDERYGIAELRHAIDHALSTLSPRDRAACLLRWDESLTYAEIGNILGLSPMGANKIILRAIERLQPLLRSFWDPEASP